MPSTEYRNHPRRLDLRAATAVPALSLALLLGSACLAQQSTAPAPPLPPAQPNLPALPPAPGNPSVQPAFTVVIDAAHGGANTGARITSQLSEKDLTLGFSVRLRSALSARGISVVTTRSSDTDLPSNERAGAANHALAGACLVLHATASGSGVHLFTSSLAPSPVSSSLLPWQTAQAAWITRSLRLSSELNSAFGQAEIPVTLGSTSIPPLDNLACPAVAIEIAPLAASPAGKAAPLSDVAYQQRLLDAIAAALLEWRIDWKQQP